MVERFGVGFYVPTCDGCGDELLEEYSFQDAIAAMKAKRWRIIPPSGAVKDWYHLCPACAGRCDFE